MTLFGLWIEEDRKGPRKKFNVHVCPIEFTKENVIQ